MCVIALAEFTRPSEKEVAAMWDSNPDGGGVAWREIDQETGENVVRFEKGLNLDDMQEYIKTLPLPFIAHFRIASSGGKSHYLTHPFPVGEDTDLRLSGESPNGALFHNGTWHSWDTQLKDSLRFGAGRLKLPTGKWMDTRAMAWLAGVYGLGYLEFISEKIIVLTPSNIEIFGSGWSYYERKKDSEEMFLVSNRGWIHRIPQEPAAETSKESATGGHSTVDPFSQGTERPEISVSGPEQLPPLTFPKDIGNAFRRNEVSWELVEASYALQMISKKQFKKLSRLNDIRSHHANSLKLKQLESGPPTTTH